MPTADAPAMSMSRTSSSVATPPIPMTGTLTARAICATTRSATGRIARPDRDPTSLPSADRRPARSIAVARQPVDGADGVRARLDGGCGDLTDVRGEPAQLGEDRQVRLGADRRHARRDRVRVHRCVALPSATPAAKVLTPDVELEAGDP